MIFKKYLQFLSKREPYQISLILIISSYIFVPCTISFITDSSLNPQIYTISKLQQTKPRLDMHLNNHHKKSFTPISHEENGYLSTILTNTYSPDEVFDGYNLIMFEQENRKKKGDKIAFLLVADINGNVIASKEIIKGNYLLADYSAELINSTTILLRIGSDLTLWNYVKDSIHTLFTLGEGHHHDFEYNPFTNTILALKKVYTTFPNGTKYRFDEIVEYNREGDSVWSLDIRTFIPPSHWCPYRDMLGKIADVTHANSLFWDVETDSIFLNLRNTNTFYKINHKTKEVIWGIGEYGNFSLFDINGNKRSNLFFHAHSIEKIARNTFILFDNDFHNQTDRMNQQSRMVEIKINSETMTANETWSWIAPEQYYCSYWGDADRLPNGNRLGTFGTKNHPNTHVGARAVEINEEGEIVWELYFENSDEFTYGIYRMDRLLFSPIFAEEEEMIFSEEENITIQFKTWYNFRSKWKINGLFSIFLNEKEIITGIHTFNKFWRPTNLKVELGPLIKGDHNLTLLLQDEGGHNTILSVDILVGVHNTNDRVKTDFFHFYLGLFCITIIFRVLRKKNDHYP
ncbi:MAG: aryl-sulfate sulfotransferase [Candidatus Heimdallarchaeota archaeon]|nr:MAG: aryl-sulfate sulfotransferase [Candidatus Heimdallarchaeota archaeon]